MRTFNGIELHDGDLIEWRDSYYTIVHSVVDGDSPRLDKIPERYVKTFTVTGNIHSREYKEKQERLDKLFWNEVKRLADIKEEADVSKDKLLEMLHDMAVNTHERSSAPMKMSPVEDAEKQLDDFIDKYVKCKTCAHFEKELFGAVCTMPETGPQELGGVVGEGMCEEHIFTDKNLENELDILVHNNLKRTLSEMENFAGQFDFEEGEDASGE